jgi:hypothetical protein
MDFPGAMLSYIPAHKQAQPRVDRGKHKNSKLKCNNEMIFVFSKFGLPPRHLGLDPSAATSVPDLQDGWKNEI